MSTERDNHTTIEGSTDPLEITSSLDTAELTSQNSKEEKEEDIQGQSEAFDPETGEINWDCPCLGGMADGTCGEEFKAAFSCFVFSEQEPKGMDCIDAFKAMQNCFRAHPEEYAREIEEEDSVDEEEEIGYTKTEDTGDTETEDTGDTDAEDTGDRKD
ncbi:Oxidoreductase [Coemansia sp. RSA 1933]|nr:Oxidoreductase [Coemansia sp. RSA 1933]